VPPRIRQAAVEGALGFTGWVLAAAVSAIALVPLPGRAEPLDPLFGYWLLDTEAAIVKIFACREGACGDIVWLREPRDAGGAPKRDRRNPDVAKRDQPLCGIALIRGLQQTGTGAWERGSIYNPRDGSSYALEAKVRGMDTLDLRGYLGIPLLGRTKIWTRTSGDRGGC